MSGIKEKVVVITGASSGIGEATARLLAERGARVVMGARRSDKLKAIAETIERDGGQARFCAIDVTRREDVDSLIEFAVREFGRIDVIVNNAGVMPLSTLEEAKVDEWNRMIDVNIRGVLHGIAAGLPRMRAQGSGQSSTSPPLAHTPCRPLPPCTAPPSLRCARSRKDFARKSAETSV